MQDDWLKPSIHPSYARLLCAHVRNKGIAVERLFRGNSLDWKGLLKTQRFISFEQFRRLALNAIELTDSPELGVEISSIIQVSAHGPLGYGAVAAPTVREAFELVQKAMATRITLYDFKLESGGERTYFRVSELMDLGEISELIYFLLLGSFRDLMIKTSSSDPEGIKVGLPFERPQWMNENHLTQFAGIELGFGSAEFVVNLPSHILDEDCLTADEFVYRNAVRECEQLLALQKSGGELAERIKVRLFECGEAYPSQENMAEELGMSARTLIRKLKAEHTSYQTLLDEVRKELACWYLQNSDLSIERIAEHLGFIDTSNFSRVFRRWMGCTPSQFKAGS